MSASTVAERLPVETGARVLEIGPGSGYYSVEVAKKIPQGKLTLIDVQEEMLEKSAQKLRAAGIDYFSTIQSEEGPLPVPSDSFDAIFMVTVFGEIEKREVFLSEASRVLNPGGVLSITEHHPDPDFEPAEDLILAVEAAGFKLHGKYGWRWAYTCNFSNPSSQEE